MTSADVLIDGFGRVRESVHAVVDGLSVDDLAYRVDDTANSIAWLVWHLTRVQDDHVADVAGLEQVWTAKGWVDRFGLPFDRLATGYGDNSDEVAAVRVDAELLTAYHDAVYQQTIDYVSGLTDDDLPRIVDDRWDPPVTLAVRLVSVIDDDAQHVGQAAFVRGVLLRRR
ncbi:MAG TPA: DUF664 domain-containing protein [Pseudonocardiaceae bacterium]|jgi:uncharacterized damage-inducible protein DinB|nr:DUF664 domain-containing protein [Pseudonocardiaceae bacterium]